MVHLDTVFGGTETVTERGMAVEQFSRILNGKFVNDVLVGLALFPSYRLPLAALFRRQVLNRVPIYEGKYYHNAHIQHQFTPWPPQPL